MPTYQYACTSCSHQLEAVQSFTDDPLTECPECSGRLRKVFNSVGIVFKGSGFYRTDSRAAADTSNGKSGRGSSSSSSSSSDSGSGGSDGGGSAKNDSGTGSSGATSSSSGAGGGATGGESKSGKKPATATGTTTS